MAHRTSPSPRRRPTPSTSTPSSTTAPGPTTTTGGGGPGSSPATTTPAGTLDWKACGRLQCATLTVPLDYTDATKGTIDLSLKRHLASGNDRIGSLLVNPGGPGVPGTSLVDQATLAFSEDLLDHFDIVGWDPRGTGASSPIDCVDDLDPLFSLDPIPDTPAEKQALIDASKQFDDACVARSGKLLPYVSTQDTARDMDEIRRALGEDKVSYFGFSYGSQLGATYATMFPTHVRAMVIDGAADPNAGYVESTKQQVVGLERGLQQMMDDCAAKTTCAFRHNGNPMAAYEALMTKLATNPLPSAGGRPAVGPGIAIYGVVSGLYVKEYWPLVTQALAAAERGDGSEAPRPVRRVRRAPPQRHLDELVRGSHRHQLHRRPRPQGPRLPRHLRRPAALAVTSLRGLGRVQLQLHLLAGPAEAAAEDHRRRRRADRGGGHDG